MNLLNFSVFYEADNGGNGGGNPADNNNDNNNDNNGNPSDDSNNTGNMIPQSRFNEINNKYKDTQQKLDELLKAKNDADEDAKKKQGEFESLYNDLKNEHDPLKEETNKYKEVFKTMLQNRLDDVPEEFKDLIPSGSEIEQMQW